MSLAIAIESPLSPEGRALVAGSQTALEEVYPPEAIFSFSAEELAQPGTRFYVARKAGVPVGCVALAVCDGYAEVKRLYVPAAGRGLGIAKALMAHLESDALAQGITLILLETGDALVQAVSLYTRLGYKIRGPFGAYPEHPASLFMEKALT